MNALTKIETGTAIAAWSLRQLDTIKRTVAKDTNDDEFNLFIEYAKVKGLDPFSRQVIAIIFNKDDQAKRQMTIITTQEGLRVMAARCGDYRPAESEPVYEYDEALKGPANPLGIVKCTVTLWKQDDAGKWWPVNGTAYWSEYAPIVKAGEGGFEWVGTGKFYPEGHAKAGKEIHRKQPVGKVTEVLDSSGLWGKMPRNQIAKCANCQALRAGWSATFSGVYGEEEFDRARAADVTASELLEQEREERRAKAIGMSNDEYPYADADGSLHFVSAGAYADTLIKAARDCKTFDALNSFSIRNREGMQRFWAKHKADALELKAALEEIAKKLPHLEKAE